MRNNKQYTLTESFYNGMNYNDFSSNYIDGSNENIDNDLKLDRKIARTLGCKLNDLWVVIISSADEEDMIPSYQGIEIGTKLTPNIRYYVYNNIPVIEDQVGWDYRLWFKSELDADRYFDEISNNMNESYNKLREATDDKYFALMSYTTFKKDKNEPFDVDYALDTMVSSDMESAINHYKPYLDIDKYGLYYVREISKQEHDEIMSNKESEEYFDEDDIIEENPDEFLNWDEVQSKSIEDFDGFITDYTLYVNKDKTKWICMYGDKEIYTPDEMYADAEFDSEEEALEWFNSYETNYEDNM